MESNFRSWLDDNRMRALDVQAAGRYLDFVYERAFFHFTQSMK